MVAIDMQPITLFVVFGAVIAAGATLLFGTVAGLCAIIGTFRHAPKPFIDDSVVAALTILPSKKDTERWKRNQTAA